MFSLNAIHSPMHKSIKSQLRVKDHWQHELPTPESSSLNGLRASPRSIEILIQWHALLARRGVYHIVTERADYHNLSVPDKLWFTTQMFLDAAGL